MIDRHLTGRHIILASQSPRRQYLLKELGLDFEVLEPNVNEVYPAGLQPPEIARYLAELKAESLGEIFKDERAIVITADTIVSLGDEILGKPSDHNEAERMLQKLSGRRHEVITAVCIQSLEKRKVFHVVSSVYFKVLTSEEIGFYIDNFRPFDKAGGYGVQEWIGYIGIEKIEGSYFNVMGLPVKELYEELLKF
ncbi:MAG: Maf family nucleotide pyrophosphatase [Bacteroidales bacterium]